MDWSWVLAGSVLHETCPVPTYLTFLTFRDLTVSASSASTTSAPSRPARGRRRSSPAPLTAPWRLVEQLRHARARPAAGPRSPAGWPRGRRPARPASPRRWRASTVDSSPTGSFSRFSLTVFSTWYASASAWLRASMTLAPRLVLRRVRLGVLHHPLDLVLRQAARRR